MELFLHRQQYRQLKIECAELKAAVTTHCPSDWRKKKRPRKRPLTSIFIRVWSREINHCRESGRVKNALRITIQLGSIMTIVTEIMKRHRYHHVLLYINPQTTNIFIIFMICQISDLLQRKIISLLSYCIIQKQTSMKVNKT